MKNWLSPSVNRAISILLICLVCWAAWFFCGKWVYLAYVTKGAWKENTSPLSQQVKVDICKKFAIENEKLCGEDAVVYSPEIFHGAIREYFGVRAYYFDATELVTRAEIEEKLGDYFASCSEPIYLSSAEDYYWCTYDLVGDGKFPISVLYYIDGTLWRMHNSTD